MKKPTMKMEKKETKKQEKAERYSKSKNSKMDKMMDKKYILIHHLAMCTKQARMKFISIFNYKDISLFTCVTHDNGRIHLFMYGRSSSNHNTSCD